MTYEQALGEALKRFRGWAGKKQKELARDTGVSATYISMVENGRRVPSVATFREFARALDCDLHEVLRLADDLLGVQS